MSDPNLQLIQFLLLEYRQSFQVESRGRLPDGIVQIGRTIAERAVQLGRDEARLTLHERRVVLPSFEEVRLVRLIEREEVHENDRSGFNPKLAFDREVGVEGAQRGHDVLRSV